MQEFLKKNKINIILIPLGILAGFLYWRFVGCTSGTCAITSNWYSSSLVGGLMGYLLSDTVKDLLKKKVKSA